MTALARERCQLAIVGGGPAGLAAATLASELGLDTVLFDEQPSPGGQVYRNVEGVARERAGDLDLLGPDYRRGLALVEAFRRSAAAYERGATVWQALPDGKLGISQGGRSSLVQAERIILATGALERPVPVPGWTLPGVMGLGAAQTLLKVAGQVPAVPTVIAGSGPLVYLAALQLARAGASLAGVLLTTPPGQARAALGVLPRALASPELWRGLAWRRALGRLGIPLVPGAADLAIAGTERAEAVSFTASGERRRLAAGLVLLHEGVVPNLQLGLAAGCRHRWDEGQHCWQPETDEWGATSAERIAIAGDGAAISGAASAVPLGRLAALDAACRLGRLTTAERDRRAAPERAALARHRRIRPFLDRLFAPAPGQRVPADDATLVCRCEEVSAGELRRLIVGSSLGINQIKAFSRCGMGLCQGRMCGLTLAELVARERGLAMAEVGYYKIRLPVRPVPLAELAELAHRDSDDETEAA